MRDIDYNSLRREFLSAGITGAMIGLAGCSSTTDTGTTNPGSISEGFENGNYTQDPTWTPRNDGDKIEVVNEFSHSGEYSLRIQHEAVDIPVGQGKVGDPEPAYLTTDISEATSDYTLTGVFSQDENYENVGSFIALLNSDTTEWVGAGTEADGVPQLRHYDGTGSDPYTLARGSEGHSVNSEYDNTGTVLRGRSPEDYLQAEINIISTDSSAEISITEASGNASLAEETFSLSDTTFDEIFVYSAAESGSGASYFDDINLETE
jgi:hypothetical protein